MTAAIVGQVLVPVAYGHGRRGGTLHSLSPVLFQ